MSSRTREANLRVGERDLKYYIFDWDDNILRMPTRIHLERRTEDGQWVPHKVSTAVFAVVRNDTARYRPPGGDWHRAFVEFQDLEGREESSFLRDTREALKPVVEGKEKPGPSFQCFKRALVEGRLFAIVTARGHRSESLKAGVRYFIRTMLTETEQDVMIRNLRGYQACYEDGHEHLSDGEIMEDYLALNHYHAVTSPEFKGRMRERAPGAESPEEAKQFAIKSFVEHLVSIIREKGIRKPVSVGFSDDDRGNVDAVEGYIREELSRQFPGIKFVIYDTSNPEIPAGRKVVVTGQLSLGL